MPVTPPRPLRILTYAAIGTAVGVLLLHPGRVPPEDRGPAADRPPVAKKAEEPGKERE